MCNVPEGFVVLHFPLKFPKSFEIKIKATPRLAGVRLQLLSSSFSKLCQFVVIILTYFSSCRVSEDSDLSCHFVTATGVYSTTQVPSPNTYFTLRYSHLRAVCSHCAISGQDRIKQSEHPHIYPVMMLAGNVSLTKLHPADFCPGAREDCFFSGGDASPEWDVRLSP